VSTLKAYRFQLRCKPAQERALRRFAGGLRWVWNQSLAQQRERHERGEKFAGYAQMCTWLTAWRHAPETAWLAEGPIHPQQQALRRLEAAYKRFFEAARAGQAGGRGGVKPPRFKARGQEPGIRFPDPKQFELDAVNARQARLKLPKLGWLRLRLSQPVDGALRNVSLTREGVGQGAGPGARWHVALQVECAQTLGALDVAPTLGIDLGVAAFAATSEGELVEPLRALAKQQVRLARYQRSVSRKVKGSANRKKAAARLGALHRRIARQRTDWLHQLSTRLADEHAVIALEDLRIQAMSASARGTAEAPGRNVRQKAGLNRGILDAAWGEFARQLAYKVQWRGGRVMLVPAAYTSRTCRICGHESADNRRTQALFSCVACGYTENADVHAAKNILAAGHAVWARERQGAPGPAACGGAVRRPRGVSRVGAAPTKQEPTEAQVT
jgi:putative transposase